jgi:hypothetical protein
MVGTDTYKDCLSYLDLQDIKNGGGTDKQKNHTSECPRCSMLIENMKYVDEAIKLFIDEGSYDKESLLEILSKVSLRIKNNFLTLLKLLKK